MGEATVIAGFRLAGTAKVCGNYGDGLMSPNGIAKFCFCLSLYACRRGGTFDPPRRTQPPLQSGRPSAMLRAALSATVRPPLPTRSYDLAGTPNLSSPSPKRGRGFLTYLLLVLLQRLASADCYIHSSANLSPAPQPPRPIVCAMVERSFYKKNPPKADLPASGGKLDTCILFRRSAAALSSTACRCPTPVHKYPRCAGCSGRFPDRSRRKGLHLHSPRRK